MFLGGSGKPKTTIKGDSGLDYDKLFHAVSHAESGDCTSAVAKRTNNCVSIMGWKNGKRYIRSYPSVQANKEAFIALWKRAYKIYPTRALAVKYSGNDKPDTWLRIVNQYYN